MKTLKTLFYNSSIRNKILFTLGMLFLFRVLSFIPVPFTNREVISQISQEGIMGFASAFTGGALANFTVMATGISAYISASIIIQLLTYSIQRLHDIQKSPGGDKVIKRYTMVAGIVMAFFISLGTTILMQKSYGILVNEYWYTYLIIAIIHCIGTGIAVWIGETITEKGFGNGVSLLICINIVSNIPTMLRTTANQVTSGILEWYWLILCIFVALSVMVAIVISESSSRKIPLTYSKATARGATNFGKTQSFLPIKLNLSGVMPIIFAATILQVVGMIGQYTKGTVADFINNYLTSGTLLYTLIMSVLIFFFSYFYSALIFNPREVADNIQSNGGCIPGIRPGKPTSDYINEINKNLTFLGATYLAVIALIPSLIFSFVGFNGLAATSMMIIVGVSLETCQKIRTETKTKTYHTF